MQILFLQGECDLSWGHPGPCPSASSTVPAAVRFRVRVNPVLPASLLPSSHIETRPARVKYHGMEIGRFCCYCWQGRPQCPPRLGPHLKLQTGSFCGPGAPRGVLRSPARPLGSGSEQHLLPHSFLVLQSAAFRRTSQGTPNP